VRIFSGAESERSLQLWTLRTSPSYWSCATLMTRKSQGFESWLKAGAYLYERVRKLTCGGWLGATKVMTLQVS